MARVQGLNFISLSGSASANARSATTDADARPTAADDASWATDRWASAAAAGTSTAADESSAAATASTNATGPSSWPAATDHGRSPAARADDGSKSYDARERYESWHGQHGSRAAISENDAPTDASWWAAVIEPRRMEHALICCSKNLCICGCLGFQSA